MPSHARTRLSLGLVLTGCVGAPPFPPTPENALGEGSSESSGSHDDQSHNPVADGTSASTVGATGSDSTTTTEPLPTTGESPQLVVSGGPRYDFGLVSIGRPRTGALTVTNNGVTLVTSMSGLPLALPFDYTGDTYPGDAGTCTDTLAAGASCTVELFFDPQDLGVYEDTLVIAYDQGRETTRALTGGGMGQSDNLLTNPGGEEPGSPPPGWSDIAAGEWIASAPPSVTPYEGAGCVHAADGPTAIEFALVQDVDVSQWSTTIDQGLMHLAFAGRGRTLDYANDQYRLVVRYRDALGRQLDSWMTDWRLESLWLEHGTQSTAPVGTRSVRVELNCRKYRLSTICDAYFDALELHAVYP